MIRTCSIANSGYNLTGTSSCVVLFSSDFKTATVSSQIVMSRKCDWKKDKMSTRNLCHKFNNSASKEQHEIPSFSPLYREVEKFGSICAIDFPMYRFPFSASPEGIHNNSTAFYRISDELIVELHNQDHRF